MKLFYYCDRKAKMCVLLKWSFISCFNLVKIIKLETQKIYDLKIVYMEIYILNNSANNSVTKDHYFQSYIYTYFIIRPLIIIMKIQVDLLIQIIQ